MKKSGSKFNDTNNNSGKINVKITIFMSFLFTNAATWLPPTVLHTSVGLTSQQRVTTIHVFGLVIYCRYIKIWFGLFTRI